MLTELLSELETRKKSREADFWATVRKLAAGEKVTPAVVERLLADCGRTPADLKTAVERMQQRRQWFEVVAGVGALEQEQAAIRQRIAAEDRKLEEAEQAHTDATVPLHARLEQIQTAMREAHAARQRLMDTCPYADLTAELADVLRRVAALRTRLYELCHTARECESLAQADLEQVQCEGGRRADYWRAKAEEHRRRAEGARAELPAVEAEIAKLEREEAALCERMVHPHELRVNPQRPAVRVAVAPGRLAARGHDLVQDDLLAIRLADAVSGLRQHRLVAQHQSVGPHDEVPRLGAVDDAVLVRLFELRPADRGREVHAVGAAEVRDRPRHVPRPPVFQPRRAVFEQVHDRP